MFQITWVTTPPRATAVEAGDCSHCSGLDWGFLPRLRVQPMHRLSNMYSMDTWDTISQTANTTRSRVFRRRLTVLSCLIKKKPDQPNQAIKFLFLQRKDILKKKHTLCQAAHQWDTNAIFGIPAEHKWNIISWSYIVLSYMYHSSNIITVASATL